MAIASAMEPVRAILAAFPPVLAMATRLVGTMPVILDPGRAMATARVRKIRAPSRPCRAMVTGRVSIIKLRRCTRLRVTATGLVAAMRVMSKRDRAMAMDLVLKTKEKWNRVHVMAMEPVLEIHSTFLAEVAMMMALVLRSRNTCDD